MKNKKYLFVTILIVVLVLILIIVTNVFSDDYNVNKLEDGVYIVPGSYKDPNLKKITNDGLKKEKCVKNICVKRITIECTKEYGTINYVVTNKGKEIQSGYINIFIGDFKGTVVYSKIGPGKSKDGFIGYKGFDLTNAKDFELKEFSFEDYKNVRIK